MLHNLMLGLIFSAFLIADVSDLDVTDGQLARVGDQLVVNGQFRAVLRDTRPQNAALNFTYLGPSQQITPLANGEIRRQIGLKLRAQDGCNLIYVMWQADPVRKTLAVSIKSNPGSRWTRECGDRGYRGLVPTTSAPVAPFKVGETHVLAAKTEQNVLSVSVDGTKVWTGILPEDTPVGGVGVRSDNCRYKFVLEAN